MKILQVVQGFPPKQRFGTQIYTYYLSKELAKRHDVYVFYPANNNDKSYSINSFEVDRLKILELNLSNLAFSEKVRRFLDFEISYKNKKIEERFRDILNKINPDVIHFQHLINLSSSLIEVARTENIPTVMTLHDYWFICPRVQLLKGGYSICSGPNKDCKNCSECWNEKKVEQLANYHVPHHFSKKASKSALNLIFRLKNTHKKFENRKEYMKTLLLNVDKIIAPSKFLRNIFIEYGIPEDKIIFSENGYNLNLFKGFKRNKEKDKIIFGFVGGVAKLKGVDVLVEAFNKINDKDVELKIYGNYDPNSNYFRELDAMIKNTNIKFMGMFEDVKEPYSEIDVLVFPSIWYENCPLVLTEARITNTPVIASDVGAIPEFVKDKETGLLFKMGDPDDLYKKIHIIVKNSGLIEKFRENIIPIKSIEEQVNELENIYGDLINQQRGWDAYEGTYE